MKAAIGLIAVLFAMQKCQLVSDEVNSIDYQVKLAQQQQPDMYNPKYRDAGMLARDLNRLRAGLANELAASNCEGDPRIKPGDAVYTLEETVERFDADKERNEPFAVGAGADYKFVEWLSVTNGAYRQQYAVVLGHINGGDYNRALAAGDIGLSTRDKPRHCNAS